jgi:hypothetical protein
LTGKPTEELAIHQRAGPVSITSSIRVGADKFGYKTIGWVIIQVHWPAHLLDHALVDHRDPIRGP